MLIKICYLYYVEGKTQNELASLFNLSRFRVGRLLKSAKEKGIVTFQINIPSDNLAEMEVQLAALYGIEQAIIVDAPEFSNKALPDQIGVAGAYHLTSILGRCKILGVAWGRSASNVVSNMKSASLNNLKVVQLTGGMGSIDGTDAYALTVTLGQKLGAQAHAIPAPVYVEDATIREALLKEKEIDEAISLAKNADAAFFGIGLPNEDGLLSRANLLTKNKIDMLLRAGAVGAVCGRFFNKAGEKCSNLLDDQIIGLSIDEIRNIKHKIAAAYGVEKVRAIQGAINGQLLDVLITDKQTALKLLHDRA